MYQVGIAGWLWCGTRGDAWRRWVRLDGKRSVVKRSVVKRSVVKRSVVKRSVVKRSVVKRSVVKRSVVKRSVMFRGYRCLPTPRAFTPFSPLSPRIRFDEYARLHNDSPAWLWFRYKHGNVDVSVCVVCV
jgi:hypothetical protein